MKPAVVVMNPSRALAETERDQCMTRSAIYRDALRLLAGRSCEHSTNGPGSCITDTSRIRDADYSAFGWCDGCIALDALKRADAIE